MNLEPNESPVWVPAAYDTIDRTCCARALKSFISTFHHQLAHSVQNEPPTRVHAV